jgi:hypothetical protein
MRTAVLLAAAAATLTATAAFAAEKQSFRHDGSTYVYETVQRANGRTVIQGRRFPSGSAFRLTVRGDRVTGTAGGQPVAFRLATAQRTGVELAAR